MSVSRHEYNQTESVRKGGTVERGSLGDWLSRGIASDNWQLATNDLENDLWHIHLITTTPAEPHTQARR